MDGMEAKTVIVSLILNIANVLLLFIILRALVYKPVKKFMTARADGIKEQLDEADTKLREAGEMKEMCKDELLGASEVAEAEKQRILEVARGSAEEIMADAMVESEQIKETAAVKATHAAEQMMEDMHEKIADLAVEIAGQVIEREVKKSDNIDIIDKYFDKVG